MSVTDQGIDPGDVVAVHVPDSRWYPPVHDGMRPAGTVFSPTDPLLPAAAWSNSSPTRAPRS